MLQMWVERSYCPLMQPKINIKMYILLRTPPQFLMHRQTMPSMQLERPYQTSILLIYLSNARVIRSNVKDVGTLGMLPRIVVKLL